MASHDMTSNQKQFSKKFTRSMPTQISFAQDELLRTSVESDIFGPYPRLGGYHGLGISVIPPTPIDTEMFLLPSPVSDKYGLDDQADIIISIAHDGQTFLRFEDSQAGFEVEEDRQERRRTPKKSTYPLSNMGMEGGQRKAIETMLQFWMNRSPETSAKSLLEGSENATDMLEISTLIRDVAAQVCPQEELQRLFSSLSCTSSRGVPRSSPVFVPNESLETSNAPKAIFASV